MLAAPLAQRPGRAIGVIVLATLLAGCAAVDGRDARDSDDEASTSATSTVEEGLPPIAELPSVPMPDCPESTIEVDDADALEDALDDAAPGDVIRLQPGRYGGTFVAEASGTPDEPIWLCGGDDSVLDGEGIRGGYVLHLDGGDHWRLVGFTATNGQKGIVADGTTGTVIAGLTVHGIGDEAVHLRTHSTDNAVIGNTIYETGLRREKFGEGVYIGSAVSNWCRYTDCEPDRSDRNLVEGNTIRDTTSEAVDVKEGTTGGIVRGNTFDGSGLVGADSWVDIKGNAWLIEGNSGVDSPLDGFQTHDVADGWGRANVFRGNTAAVNGPGFGFAFRAPHDNAWTCDNVVTGASDGDGTVPCEG